MHHLHAEEATTHLAKGTYSGTDLKLGDLARIEMQETQTGFATGITNLADQRLARAILGFSVDNLAFNQRLIAWQEVTDERQPSFIYVP
jgi:hypothetical protein